MADIQDTSNRIHCPICGGTHPKEAQFCAATGKLIPAQEVPAPQSAMQPPQTEAPKIAPALAPRAGPVDVGKMLCPHCHQLHPAGATFCPETGLSIEIAALTCPACHNPIRSEFAFCPHCNYPLSPDASTVPPSGFPKKTLLTMIGVGLVVILLAGWLAWNKGDRAYFAAQTRLPNLNLPPIAAFEARQSTPTPGESAAVLGQNETEQPGVEVVAALTGQPIVSEGPTLTETVQPTATTLPPLPNATRTAIPTPTPNTPPGMASIDGGTFKMGATEDEMRWHLNSCNHYASCNVVDYEDMLPQHLVELSPYFIDIHEVTNAEYRECAVAGACAQPSASAIRQYLNSDYYSNQKYDSYPVVGVNWNDGVNFCEWSGKRLPTEAEWEYAAKGEDGQFFPWTRVPNGYTTSVVFGGSTPLANYCDRDCSMENWNDTSLNDGWKGPAPVMSYPPGPFGLYDMAGNVTEWIQDYYGENFYQTSPRKDPVNTTWKDWRITRGGGWNNGIYHLTSMMRSAQSPSSPKAFIGFRCVMGADDWQN